MIERETNTILDAVQNLINATKEVLIGRVVKLVRDDDG